MSPRLAAMRAELASIDAELAAEPAYNTTAAYERRGNTSHLDRLTRRRMILRECLRSYATDHDLERAEAVARANRGI
jgi:hypothetical protein